MKYISAVLSVVAAAILLTVAVPASGTILPPYETVRAVNIQIVRTDSEDRAGCSAVVIAPDTALTARHCLFLDTGAAVTLTVDGFFVEQAVTSRDDGKDVAVLTVPGLQCPCASLGVRPAKGDQVLAIGFPADREGERRITAVGRVEHVGALNQFSPWFEIDNEFIVTTPLATYGDSGGGLFTMQDGEWKLIGTVAIGFPDMPFGPIAHDGYVPVDIAKEFLP